MVDVLKAMSTSGAILLPIVILIIIVTIATVKRGEQEMGGGHHGLATDGHVAAMHTGTATVAAPAKKAGVQVVEEVSVMQILLFGIILFTAVMAVLLLVSVIQHS